jgi:DNA end-binding protein Ku
MARAIWSGAISFGLVTIPVKLVPAIRADEEVHFHYLHAKDNGRIKNIRKCEVDGEEVPWSEIVRGFEYEKGSYVVLDDADLDAIRNEVTQSVEIQAFVDGGEIDPMLFDTPYYLEPQKSGRHAYALLRGVLERTGKVGIAQVVLRTRAHLAALRPSGRGLVVELLRYPHEVLASSEVDLPPAGENASASERKMAQMLVGAMTKKFDPSEYKDEYEEKLRAVLRERAKGKAKPHSKAKAAKASNVVDLVALLKESMAKRTKNAKTSPPRRSRGTRAAVRASRHA